MRPWFVALALLLSSAATAYDSTSPQVKLLYGIHGPDGLLLHAEEIQITLVKPYYLTLEREDDSVLELTISVDDVATRLSLSDPHLGQCQFTLEREYEAGTCHTHNGSSITLVIDKYH
ncbi:hypothetical protein [Ferrimonas aestuarii]|uniref:Uncharacterized protein n=1 Tax=Ferrimonas aestuarii TaxID=2569539 RepID=A0A4U1BL85_9GAMM|nr:hypothetical protein [Ferrimonas aestuarii]TKB53687.1 hypothetical protein FCL42_14015 [Ferrimonas aestuarii]